MRDSQDGNFLQGMGISPFLILIVLYYRIIRMNKWQIMCVTCKKSAMCHSHAKYLEGTTPQTFFLVAGLSKGFTGAYGTYAGHTSRLVHLWTRHTHEGQGGMLGANFATLRPSNPYVCWSISPFVLWGFPNLGRDYLLVCDWALSKISISQLGWRKKNPKIWKHSPNVPKCPKMSQNVPTCPKMSQTTKQTTILVTINFCSDV